MHYYFLRIIFVASTLAAVACIAASEKMKGDNMIGQTRNNNQATREISGACGEHATWTFNERTSTLTISGYGAMEDYSSPEDVPWRSYRTNINIVVIEEGLTTIGNRSFAQHQNMVSVTIPSSVTSIKTFAFYGCIALPSLIIPSGVKSIGDSAFSGCNGLTDLIIPSSVESIGNVAFFSCSNLLSLAILSENVSVERFPFESCSNLTTVIYLGSSEPDCREWGFSTNKLLSFVCVPNSYNSDSFCNVSSFCNKYSSDDIIARHNRCFEIIGYNDSGLIVQKRESAINWMNRKSGCVDYICDNETGHKTIFQCTGDEICVNDKCVAKEGIDNQWTVEIDVNNMDVAEMNTTEFTETISAMTGIEANQLKIGINVNEKGKLIRITVYTKEVKSAERITASVNDCVSQGSCQSTVFRYIASVHFLSNDPVTSAAHHHAGGDLLNCLFIITIITAIASFLF